jgi:rod shape-determining protein MreD
MKRIILPFILAIAFYSESLFTDLIPENVFGLEMLIVPRFLLVLFILMGIYYFENTTYIYAAVFGLLFDIYYTEIIGIYLCFFPITVYLASKMAKVIHVNFFTVSIIGIICLGIVEILVYGSNVLIRQVVFPFEHFIQSRLYATLIFNFSFLIIVFYPFSRMLMRRKKEDLME